MTHFVKFPLIVSILCLTARAGGPESGFSITLAMIDLLLVVFIIHMISCLVH